MQFSDVIGQQPVKQQLMQMSRMNRLSHALLFLGKEGSGALSLARAFAQYLVCEKINGRPGSQDTASLLFADAPAAVPAADEPASDSCGECPACKKAALLIHPDIHFSYPIIPRKAGDKPVCTDYIAEWREFVKAQPYGNVYDWLQFI